MLEESDEIVDEWTPMEISQREIWSVGLCPMSLDPRFPRPTICEGGARTVYNAGGGG